MRTFPAYLTPENIDKFKTFKRNRELCYLRRYIYETMLSDEFLTDFGINIQNVRMGDNMLEKFSFDVDTVNKVISELTELGFEVNLAYGGTMLFVYPPGKKPVQIVNCAGFD